MPGELLDFHKLTHAEINEQVALALGRQVVHSQWPCYFEPECGNLEAVPPKYGEGSLVILPLEVDRDWSERETHLWPVYLENEVALIPVTDWAGDDGRAFKDLWPEIHHEDSARIVSVTMKNSSWHNIFIGLGSVLPIAAHANMALALCHAFLALKGICK